MDRSRIEETESGEDKVKVSVIKGNVIDGQ